MSNVVIALVIVAALACPAHMLWQMRRGSRAKSRGCCGRNEPSLQDLHARYDAVAGELAAREAPRSTPGVRA